MITLEYIIKKGETTLEAHPQLKITIPVSGIILFIVGWYSLFPSSFHENYYFLHHNVKQNLVFFLIISGLLITVSILRKVRFLSTILMFLGFMGFGLAILSLYQQKRINTPSIGVLSSQPNSLVGGEVRSFIQHKLKNINDIDIKVINYSTNNSISDIKERLKTIKNDNLDILVIDQYLPISHLEKKDLERLINPYTLYIFTKPLKKKTLLEFDNFMNVSSSLYDQIYHLAKDNPIQTDTAYYIVDSDVLGETTEKTLKDIYTKLGNKNTTFKKLNDLAEISFLKEKSTILFLKWENSEIRIPPNQQGKVTLLAHSEVVSNQKTLTPIIEKVFITKATSQNEAEGLKITVAQEIVESFYRLDRPLSFIDFNKNMAPILFNRFFIDINQSGEIIYKHK